MRKLIYLILIAIYFSPSMYAHIDYIIRGSKQQRIEFHRSNMERMANTVEVYMCYSSPYEGVSMVTLYPDGSAGVSVGSASNHNAAIPATQWTYITSDRELSITEPTAEELMECNPFAIVNHYAKYYNVRAIQGKANTVELSPKHSGTSIRHATITINPDNNLPDAINVTLANGHTFSVKVSSISRGGNIPQASFVYNKSSHPAATINDLR